MSSLPFSVDMETMEGHVPSTSEFITPRISGKQHPQQFQLNGLTGIIELDVNTQKDKKMNVIVYCQPAKSSAEILQDEIQQGGHSASLLCLTEPKDLKDRIQLKFVESLYMMADSSLFELLFQKRHHRGFHSVVNDFMDELEDNNKCISLFNRMEKGDERFMTLFHLLPKNCAKIVREITVQGGKVQGMKKRPSKSIDSGIADLSLNENSKQDSGCAADSGNKLKDGPSSDQRIKSDSIKTGPGGDGREIVYSRKDADLMSSPPEGLMASSRNAELYSEESGEGEAEVVSEDKEELELTEDESLSEDSEEEPQSNVDVQAVQIGHHQTMEVQRTGSQMVIALQEGWNNTLEFNILPQASKSKVIVVFTTNPHDENLDNLLLKEFNDETELINVRVADLGGSNVKVSSGSVVMEIEVKPGVTIDKQYIEKLINVVFSGKAGRVIPDNTKFDVDIQTKMVVPFDQLGKYVHLNPEKIHENCVSKEKYEEKVKEIQQLKSRLVQGILKNPKQDQVLQNALKNFISSVLTDFAFAMATEIPALQVSGSRRQEATAREEERNPVVSGLNTTREPECVVQGLSRQADSKYNEITHTKGSRLIKEQSDPEPSSTEIITRHGKWRFDVLIIRWNETFSWQSLSELLTKNGIKCEIISFLELHEDHHMLKFSKYVVYHDDGWHFDEELFEMISFHHRRVICLYYEGFPLSSRRHLPLDMVLTFINMMGKFWREDLLEQLGRREHQTQRETTFDDELTEKSHQLFDSVYAFGKNRPDFLVKHDGPEVSIQWTEQTHQKAVHQTGGGRQVHWTDQKQREESMTAWKRGDRKDKTKTPTRLFTHIPSVQHIYQQPLPLRSQVFEGMSTQNLKSSEQIIEESVPKVFSGLYDEVPSFTGKFSTKGETTGMRRAEQGERTGMRKTGTEGEKEYAGATKLAQKEEKHTDNLEEVLESYAREGKKYEDFREAVHKSLGSESSWRTIASVLYATKNVMSRLGTTMAAPLRQLAEKFVQEECADFIIQQGGWEAVLDEECSDLESDLESD